MHYFIRFTLLLTAISLLTSCFPAVVAGGVIVGTTAAEDRSAGDKLDDNIIKIKIKDRLGEENFKEMFARVTVTVHEGRVLLTGSVKNQSNLSGIVEITWKVHGVKEVINELVVSSRTLGSVTNDTIAANTIRSKMLFDGEIKSINYKIEVNNGIAYVLGIARSQAELNQIIEIARHTRGINKVINHAISLNDMRRRNEL